MSIPTSRPTPPSPSTPQAARSAGHSAADLVRGILDGRGGGSADTAQGGGMTPDRATAALEALLALLASRGES
ncbi:hypothetical protein [Streptomyces sp. TS71-3]|uniref:hypothetical protein n=1 Tax=Streptomyces sp. TS71-3 TaxID=2733862 RepID=UPI001BB31E0B|nr:hypothetical protein [Streptomyces sp. TS71-3]